MPMYKPRIGFSRKVARKLLTRHSITSPPVPLEPILHHEGLEVRYSKRMGRKSSGIFYPSRKQLIVNANHHIHRQRFTIAHELGHYFLIHEGGQFIDEVGFDGEYGTGILEKGKELMIADTEANEFASELLIPLTFIKADFKNENNPEILARRYNVSRAALFVSLLKHRLIK